jgi:hypothetical protein
LKPNLTLAKSNLSFTAIRVDKPVWEVLLSHPVTVGTQIS